MRNVLLALPPMFVLAVFVLAVCSVPAAFAEEEPAAPVTEPKPAPKPKPDPAVASYIGESLMPGEKDTPEGWTLLDEASAASGGPDEASLAALAEPLGLDEDNFYPQLQSYEKDGATVTIAIVDVDAKVYAYKHALAAKATECGWRTKDLGHPGRILVIGGPSAGATELEAALVEHTVYKLSDMAMNRIRGGVGRKESEHGSIIAFTKAIEALAPNSGTAEAVLGFLPWIKSGQGLKPKEKPRRSDREKAFEHWARSLATGVRFPPKGSVLVFIAGRMGGQILEWKNRGALSDATRFLEIAVESEREARTTGQRYTNRYNLSCAYARLERIDDAIKMLEGSLKILRGMPASFWRAQYEHIDEKDPDMGPLRSDPRFSELMSAKENQPPKPKKRKMPPAKPGSDNPHK